MRILMTNHRLREHTGTELYLRDIALALAQRGHTPILFSPDLGPLADEIRHEGIPVVSALDQIAEPPDVIHGHHHIETVSALMYFNRSPALYVCHGWRPWEEAPPKFRRIYRYLAVDTLTRNRIVIENGIPSAKTIITPNFVDMSRFKVGGNMAPTPRRMLFFSNYIAPGSPALLAAREAARRTGLELETAGKLMGTHRAEPERLLPEFDIILAQGRSVLEALACGKAAIVCSSKAFGPLVTSENFDRLRAANFGILAQTMPVEERVLVEQIQRYDVADISRVSARIHAEAGLEQAVDRLETIYAEVIEEHRRHPVDDDPGALARYFERLTKRMRALYACEENNSVLHQRMLGAEHMLTCRDHEIHSMQQTGAWKLRGALLRFAPIRALSRLISRLLV